MDVSCLESLRDNLSVSFNRHVANAFRENRSSEAKLTGSLSLMEQVSKYVAELQNSDYLSRDNEIQRAEKGLWYLENQLSNPDKLSFGHYIQGIRTLDNALKDEYRVEELRELCSAKLPENIAQSYSKLRLAINGRELDVSVAKIDKFVAEQIKGFHKNPGFLDYVDVVVEIRNAKNHHHDWWSKEAAWFEWLNQHLSKGLCGLLMWEPLRGILTSYKRVERVNSDQQNPSQWTISFRPENEPRWKYSLEDAEIVVPNEPASLFYVQDTEEGVEYLFDHVEFPCRKVPRKVREEAYRREFLKKYLSVGMIDETAYDELETKRDQFLISKEEATALQDELQETISEIRKQSDADEKSAKITELRLKLGERDGRQVTELEAKLDQFSGKLEDAVLQKIEDATIVSHDRLRRDTRLSNEVLGDVINSLEQEQAIRTFEGLGGEELYTSALTEPIKDFEEHLENLHSGATSIQNISSAELFSLCYHLLPYKTDSVQERYKNKFEQLEDVDDTSGADTDGVLELTLEGETIGGASVPELFRLVHETVGDDSRFRSGIPFPMGKERYLVNDQPVHQNDMGFVNAVQPEDGVYYEGDISRWKALIELKKVLSSCGFAVSIPFDVADEEGGLDSDEKESSRAVLSERPRNQLGLLITRGEQHHEIVGTTVSSLFSDLLKYLDNRTLLTKEELPVYAGRVRYLLAEKPVHANERPFRTVVSRDIKTETGETVETFMEAAFSRQNALEHAKSLLSRLGIGEIEEFDRRDRLKVEIEGRFIEGSTVRDFVTQITDYLQELGHDLADYSPIESGHSRYFINDEPVHLDGWDFNSEHEYGGVFFEVNMGYPETRRNLSTLFDLLGLDFDFDADGDAEK